MNRADALKVALLLLAAGLTLWLVLGVRESHQFRISASTPSPEVPALPTARQAQAAAQGASATTVMVKPRYTGQDDEGHAWEVTADNADQQGGMASSTLVLSRVEALWRDVSSTYTLSADAGDYQASAKTLALRGNVTGAAQNGLGFATPAATANLSTREVAGTQGVTVTGPLGGYDATLTAQNFHLDTAAKKLTFTRNVHLVLKK